MLCFRRRSEPVALEVVQVRVPANVPFPESSIVNRAPVPALFTMLKFPMALQRMYLFVGVDPPPTSLTFAPAEPASVIVSDPLLPDVVTPTLLVKVLDPVIVS